MHPVPSLHALYVFEVAARWGSFTRAARELHVTQTAVSHQIKQLEAELGQLLFKRSGRGLSLTAAGLAWQQELTVVFGQLRDASHKLRARRQQERPIVSLTTIASFGTRWLVPRLGAFLSRHPEIELRISTSEKLVDFAVESVDIGVRFGTGKYPGLVSEKLLDDHFVVVATPGKARGIERPGQLLEETLLRDDEEDAWARWFAARRSVAAGAPVRYHQLTDSGMLVEAAARGQGVALARWSLIQDELLAGRLTVLFPRLPPLPVGRGYYLVGLRETFRRPEVAAFRSWLLAELAPLTR